MLPLYITDRDSFYQCLEIEIFDSLPPLFPLLRARARGPEIASGVSRLRDDTHPSRNINHMASLGAKSTKIPSLRPFKYNKERRFEITPAIITSSSENETTSRDGAIFASRDGASDKLILKSILRFPPFSRSENKNHSPSRHEIRCLEPIAT